MKPNAILLSGGVDSAAVAAIERPALAVGIDYGQQCAIAELTRSEAAVAVALQIPFIAVRANCSDIGSGDLSRRPALTGIAPSREWWPFRNQLLATLAAPIVLERGIGLIMFGTVSSDGFHSDGKPEFFSLLDSLMRFQEGGVGTVTFGTRHKSKQHGNAFTTANEALHALEKKLGKHNARWTYTDATGKPVGAVIRWDNLNGKDMRPLSLHPSGWRIGAMPEPRFRSTAYPYAW